MVLTLRYDIPFYEPEIQLSGRNIHYHRIGYQCIKTTHDDCYLSNSWMTQTNIMKGKKRLIYQPKSSFIKMQLPLCTAVPWRTP